MSDLVRVSTVLRLLYPHGLDYIEQADLDRGEKLHFMMECWVNDQLHGYKNDPIPEIQPVVKWLSRQKVMYVAAEERQHHHYGYTGQPDADVIFNDEPWIWDWKFTEVLSEQNRMQLTAYHHFEGRKCAFIQCKRDGTVKMVRCKPDPRLWSAFLSGLNVLRFQQSFRPLQFTDAQIDKIKQEVNELSCQPNL